MDKGMLQQLQELQQIDQDICKNVHAGILFIMKERNTWAHNNKAAIEKNLRIAGSYSENAVLARFFKTNELFPDQVNRECELDLEFTLCEIPESLKEDIIIEVPEKKGFVKMQVKNYINVLKEQMRTQGWEWEGIDELEEEIRTKTMTKEGFLQPYKMKDIFLGQAKFRDSKQRGNIIIAAVLGKSKNSISMSVLNEEITRASVAMKLLVEVDEVPFTMFSLDYVTVFQLQWWPSIGDEWKYRTRNWPEQNDIDKIATNGYIIAKPSDTTDIESTELRYSFAHVEQELVRMRSPHQNLIYLIFKAMFYKWIKPINEEMMSSYIAKTIMFWTCEEFPPRHEMWKENFTSTIEALSLLFTRLLHALDAGILEYYFNRNINLLKDISQEDIQKVCKAVKQVLVELKENNTRSPIQIDKEMNFGKLLLEFSSTALGIFNTIEKMGFSKIVSQPELLEVLLSQLRF